MSGRCKIVRVGDGMHVDTAGRALFSADEAKMIAWTLAREEPGTEFEVLDDGEPLVSYLGTSRRRQVR